MDLEDGPLAGRDPRGAVARLTVRCRRTLAGATMSLSCTILTIWVPEYARMHTTLRKQRIAWIAMIIPIVPACIRPMHK